MGSGSSLSSDVRLNSSLPDHLRRKHQDPALIRRVLRETRTIAIVGLSPNAQKASHFVGRYLQHHGYRIVPVYPRPVDILGEPSYPTLLDIPDELAAQIDLVNVFRKPEACPEIARQAVQIGAKALWLQLKIISLEAAEIAEAGGLDVVMDKCVKIEHGRYAGGLHTMGMNTEIVTARKARRWF